MPQLLYQEGRKVSGHLSALPLESMASMTFEKLRPMEGDPLGMPSIHQDFGFIGF